VRLAMSYVSMPPEADHDVAADLARLMTPAAERYGELRDDAGVLGPRRSGAIGSEGDDAGEWAGRGTTGERGEADQ
jgi:hypothetical protein